MLHSTPPACFLSCINELSHQCRSLSDITCLCGKSDLLLGCLVDICPYGTFESARDHYFGTCLEHKYQINPPQGQSPPFWNPPPPVASPSVTFQTVSSTITTAVTSSRPTPRPIITAFVSDSFSSPLNSSPNFPYASLSTLALASPGESNLVELALPPTVDREYQDIEFCEWEETKSTDSQGNLIILRKPIDIPEKYKPAPNMKLDEPTKVVYILKYVTEGATGSIPVPVTVATKTQLSIGNQVALSTTISKSMPRYHTKRMQVIRRMKHPGPSPVSLQTEVIYEGYIE
ncbi:uncharacterized protein KQ657_001642 [Scheffersomyces spartinae]|uniref:CFEM domain-containing protein n=1 Tax=Scheffersomyces spartinae TaxID=45513 RepID=A0A9P7V711_9ASCO|nr:uncharacterized protein KQ657_001642 [Scheffersomyces spartinae]KAG7192545.1 hypothetical protein KQ657_001642 [Scheffersomyces spartinae]